MSLPAGAAPPADRNLVGGDDIAAADPLLGVPELHARRPFYGNRDSSYTLQSAAGSVDTLDRDSTCEFPSFSSSFTRR
jgi:hypothetical protein